MEIEPPLRATGCDGRNTQLICQMSGANRCGSTEDHGELLKLGMRMSAQTQRGQSISMVGRRSPSPSRMEDFLAPYIAHAVLRHSGLPSLELAMDPRCSPQRMAPLIWQISWRISTVTAGRPQRCFDYPSPIRSKSPRCQRITVSRSDDCKCAIHLGNSRPTPPKSTCHRNKSKSLRISASQHIDCCLSTRICCLKSPRPQQVAGNRKDQST